jgi:hypothetical protein
MRAIDRIKLTTKLSGAKLTLTFNPLQWKLLPSVKSQRAYADELFLVGDYFRMVELSFLGITFCAWVDTGSVDDLLA